MLFFGGGFADLCKSGDKKLRPIMAPHIMYSGSAQSMSKLVFALFVKGGCLPSVCRCQPKTKRRFLKCSCLQKPPLITSCFVLGFIYQPTLRTIAHNLLLLRNTGNKLPVPPAVHENIQSSQPAAWLALYS
jgi:hypothetical protein